MDEIRRVALECAVRARLEDGAPVVVALAREFEAYLRGGDDVSVTDSKTETLCLNCEHAHLADAVGACTARIIDGNGRRRACGCDWGTR